MHAGNNDGTDDFNIRNGLQALHTQLPWTSQAFPVVSHADLGVRQCHAFLLSSTETILSSNMPATGTLVDLQPAFNTQVSHWPPSWQASGHVVL